MCVCPVKFDVGFLFMKAHHDNRAKSARFNHIALMCNWTWDVQLAASFSAGLPRMWLKPWQLAKRLPVCAFYMIRHMERVTDSCMTPPQTVPSLKSPKLTCSVFAKKYSSELSVVGVGELKTPNCVSQTSWRHECVWLRAVFPVFG